jgi:hypothetical protein
VPRCLPNRARAPLCRKGHELSGWKPFQLVGIFAFCSPMPRFSAVERDLSRDQARDGLVSFRCPIIERSLRRFSEMCGPITNPFGAFALGSARWILSPLIEK